MALQLSRAFGAVLLGACLTVSALSNVRAESLSYKGSETIGGTVLPEIIKKFHDKTGISFSSVETPGASAGLKALMAGEVAIAGMTRALTRTEMASKPHFVVMGFDAVSIYVNPRNPLTNITKEQVKSIFTGEITDWQQVNGRKGPIEVIISDPGRANVQDFQRKVLDGAKFGPAVRIIQAYDDILHYLAAHENVITFASVALKRDDVKTIAFDGVTPSQETVREGTYFLRQPLVLVAKEAPKGDLKKFFDFVQSREAQQIVAQYFIPYQPLLSMK
jgi:phosphate transport system substrate-binding protein